MIVPVAQGMKKVTILYVVRLDAASASFDVLCQ